MTSSGRGASLRLTNCSRGRACSTSPAGSFWTVCAIVILSKDLEDARNVLAVRQGELEKAYIRRWRAEHGTTAILDYLMS